MSNAIEPSNSNAQPDSGIVLEAIKRILADCHIVAKADWVDRPVLDAICELRNDPNFGAIADY